MDKHKHGTMASGDRHYAAVIPDADLEKIRKQYVPQCPVYGAAAVARRYGVTRHCVSRILRGLNRVG